MVKGWATKLIEAVTNAFGNFVGIFKKHGLLYTLVVLILFVLLWSLVIHPIKLDRIIEHRIEQMFIKNNEQMLQVKADGIERRYKADEAIGEIMTKVIDKYDVNRVALLEAHNSITNLNGVDFLYMSCSMEMLNPNTPHLNYISEDLQKQIILNLLGQDLITSLKHRDYLYYSDTHACTHPQHRLIHKIAHAGDNECLLIPFTDANHRPLMVMIISGENLKVNEIIEYVEQFKGQITQLLM